MKTIYQKMWELAKPYYEKGRPMDTVHIEWMTKEAEMVCEMEGFDESIFMPLVILHDVGYSQFPKDKGMHMKSGAKIAGRILKEIGYPQPKLEKIVRYVSVHDNWALDDDSVFEDPLLAAFNDLDFTWTVAPKGLPAVARMVGKTEKEILEWAEANEKHKRRPFSTKTTSQLYERCVKDRQQELKDFQN